MSASLTVRKGAPKLGVSNRSEEEEEDEAALVERQIRKAIPSTDIEDPDYAEAPRPTPGLPVPRRLADEQEAAKDTLEARAEVQALLADERAKEVKRK